MELLFKHGRLSIASSGDMPGALVIGILSWEGDEVFHHIIPSESRIFLTELLGTDIFGEYTYGPIRVIKHPTGWLEFQITTWTDPEPVAVVPEHISGGVLDAVRLWTSN